MLPVEDSSTHSGRTASGNNWTLQLSSPGPNFGDAEFTNSAGTTVDGFWRRTGTGICQSYNGRESWSCHDIFACEGEDNRFAMRNSEGEITSVLETSVGQTYETDSLMEDGSELGETLQSGTLSESLLSAEGRKFSVSTPQGRSAFEVFGDSHYVVIAARPTLLEAQQLAASFTNTEYQIAIFESQNGWFAVTGALLTKYAGESPQDFAESVASLIQREGFPDDAYLTQGQSFVRLMPLAQEHTFTNPYFIRSSITRETEMFWAALIDGKVEATPEGYSLSQGEDVTVWEQLGDYCVIGPFEPFAVACEDVIAFADGDVDTGQPPTDIENSLDGQDLEQTVAQVHSSLSSVFEESSQRSLQIPLDCAAIDSDILRLQCFDQEFSGGVTTSSGASEIFEKLTDLVNVNNDPLVMFEVSANEGDVCNLLVSHVVIDVFGGSYVVIDAFTSELNLRNVARFEGLTSFFASGRGPRTVFAINNTGFVGHSTWRRTEFATSSQFQVQDVDVDSLPMQREFSSQRSALLVVPIMSRENPAEALALIESLHISCQEN